jgi:4-hydroxy-tetrahydrodipicolinate synthase
MDPRLVQSFKAALELTGSYGGPTRPPRLPLDEEDMGRVRAAL